MTQQEPVLLEQKKLIKGHLALSEGEFEEEYRGIVRKAVIAAAGVSMPGSFVVGVDIAGTAGVWATMIGAMAKKSGRDIDFDLISKVTGSAVSGVAGYYFASKILTYAALPLLAAFPIAGIPAVVGMNGALNAIFTHRLAKIVYVLLLDPQVDDSEIISLVRDISGYLKGIPTPGEVKEIVSLIKE